MNLKYFYLIFIMFITSVSAQNSYLKGKKEFSLSFSYQSMKAKDDRESSWTMSLPFHFNFFVADNIGVGAEVNFTDFKGTENTGIVLNFLVEANFPLEQGKSTPFVLAGYGYSNGSFLFDRMAIKNYKDTGIGVLNLGIGLKLHITEEVCARVEGRYQNFTGETEYGYIPVGSSNKYEIDVTYLKLFMGFSIIL